ncbi:MAG: alanine racemase [Syntrophomonas sp.]|nr:alanine racemase [Syntrophomonas sp.]
MNKTGLAWAEINLTALGYNLDMVRKQLQVGTRIMAVVKANAYGHGAVEVSRALTDYGVDALAVATFSEAVQLRQNQIAAPILVLGMAVEQDIEELFEQNLTPALNNFEMAVCLNEWGRKRNQRIKTHLRIDTGMGSYGLLPGECMQHIDELVKMEHLDITGIFTHINAIYGGKLEAAASQINIFDNFINELRQKGITIPITHASSSPAVLKLPQAEYDLVRLGIVLYGLPCGNVFLDEHIKPVMQIKTRVVSLKDVGSDFQVGYGCAFTTINPARIATLAMGYGDAGFLHYFKNGEVLVHGHRAPILGKSCMDHLIVDVTAIDDVAIGDEVVVMGEQGSERIKAAEIAMRCGICMDNLDLVCLLSSRVPRIYIR